MATPKIAAWVWFLRLLVPPLILAALVFALLEPLTWWLRGEGAPPAEAVDEAVGTRRSVLDDLGPDEEVVLGDDHAQPPWIAHAVAPIARGGAQRKRMAATAPSSLESESDPPRLVSTIPLRSWSPVPIASGAKARIGGGKPGP